MASHSSQSSDCTGEAVDTPRLSPSPSPSPYDFLLPLLGVPPRAATLPFPFPLPVVVVAPGLPLPAVAANSGFSSRALSQEAHCLEVRVKERVELERKDGSLRSMAWLAK